MGRRIKAAAAHIDGTSLADIDFEQRSPVRRLETGGHQHKKEIVVSNAVVLHTMRRQRLHVYVCLRARTVGSRATLLKGEHQRGDNGGDSGLATMADPDDDSDTFGPHQYAD